MPTKVTHYHDVAVLTVKDELAADTVESFVQKANQTIDGGCRHLLVDCSTIKGIDSLGLEALVDLQNKCEQQLGAVKLCALDDTCAKILHITRLARRFEVFDDLETAVKSFA
jgi:anti-anti-sigma factor